MKLIENNIQKIIDLCKKHKVHKLFVFGSILTNRFNDNSDIDLVVDFNKAEVSDYFDNYFDFKYALENLFGTTDVGYSGYDDISYVPLEVDLSLIHI